MVIGVESYCTGVLDLGTLDSDVYIRCCLPSSSPQAGLYSIGSIKRTERDICSDASYLESTPTETSSLFHHSIL